MEGAVGSLLLNSLIWCAQECQLLISQWVKSMATSHACEFDCVSACLFVTVNDQFD